MKNAELTRELAGRIASAVARGQMRICIVSSAGEEKRARAEGWSDDYSALRAVTEQGEQGPNSIADMVWQFAAKHLFPKPRYGGKINGQWEN